MRPFPWKYWSYPHRNMGGGNEPKEDKKPIMPLGRLKKNVGLIIGWLIDVGRRLFLEHLQKSENPDLPTDPRPDLIGLIGSVFSSLSERTHT